MIEENMGYWKELPYRGEPPDKTPKPRKRKRIRTAKEKRRENVISAFIIFISLTFISCLIYFDPNLPRDQTWKIALFVLAILLLMVGLSAGINTVNKHLRGYDLDDSKHSDKEELGKRKDDDDDE
jgi:hypothetical protein